MIASHNTKNLAAIHRRGQRLVIFTTICSTFLILFCGVSAAQLIRQYRAAHSETASEGSNQKTALEASDSPQGSAQNETTTPSSGRDSSSTSPSSNGSTTPSSPNSTPSNPAKPSSGPGFRIRIGVRIFNSTRKPARSTKPNLARRIQQLTRPNYKRAYRQVSTKRFLAKHQ